MNVKQIILDSFKSGKLQFKTQNEILSLLHLPPSYKKPAKAVLKGLTTEGELIKTEGGRYATPEKAGAFCATVKANPQGFAFLIPEGFLEREHDYFVPAKRLHGALNKDKVLAVPYGRDGDEAAVIKVLSRGMRRVTGRLEKRGKLSIIIPDDRAFSADVTVHNTLLNGAKDGDKVVAEITNFANSYANAKIIAILGTDGELIAEEEAIIASAELRTAFPPYVEESADKVSKETISLKDRRDLRDILTVTIDGADTRDIDDAVSLEKIDGKLRLGVHIADVSHYVKYNGCIDKEAYERGTSVYFPDRVLPMLPKSLSNGACSLNEGEDRYAMTCFMYFDDKGNKVGYELCESVIKSDRRLTYDEVTDVLENVDKQNEYGEIADMLKEMANLCIKLEKNRHRDGEVALDVKEAHIYVDERGEIVIPDCKRALSHRIIEQFMVSANETVATYALKRKAPFLYRIHERPSAEKASLLYGFVKDLGINAKGNPEDVSPKDYQRILSEAEGKSFAPVVNKVMLRSMQKARYSQENLKHFGLASECYCHFTSPIRRYPDLFVHRVLKILLKGDNDGELTKFARIAPSAAIDTSERERRAEQVERDVDDVYKTAYMQKRLGEEFDGIISGVTETGIFVELANSIEGMVRFELLPADRYELYPEKFLLKGSRFSFRLGDQVKVKAVGCDLASRRIQFELV